MSPTPTYVEPPRHSGLVTALMAGAIIALIGANIYLYSQIDHMRTDIATTHEKVMTEISNLRDASSDFGVADEAPGHVEGRIGRGARGGAEGIEPG